MARLPLLHLENYVWKIAMRLLGLLFCSVAGLGIISCGVQANASEKLVVGWVERVRIYPGDFEIHAKIDTGAKTSSLNAPDLKVFTRDGEEWVSFEVTNRGGVTQRFEEKIFRVSKIRQHGGRIQQRPVVMLGVCVGIVYKMTEVNLIDRKNFNYQMLIGRRLMKDQVIVDPGRTFIVKPQCDRNAK